MTSLDALTPEFIPYAKAFVQFLGNNRLHPQITSTRRSRAEQSRLYDAYIARGRTGLPAAPPGASAHEYGYAVDLLVSPQEYLYAVGNYWSQLGGVWHPSDPVHFEYPGFVPQAETAAESPLVGIIETLSSFLPPVFWLGKTNEREIRALAARFGIY